jgi:hypothetical protein
MNIYSKIAILLTVWFGALSSTVGALELEVGLGVTVERDQNDLSRYTHRSHRRRRRLQMDNRPKAAPTMRTDDAKESPVERRPKPPEQRGRRRPMAPVRQGAPAKRQMRRPIRAPARRPN